MLCNAGSTVNLRFNALDEGLPIATLDGTHFWPLHDAAIAAGWIFRSGQNPST